MAGKAYSIEQEEFWTKLEVLTFLEKVSLSDLQYKENLTIAILYSR